jgi:hypothetical protein
LVVVGRYGIGRRRITEAYKIKTGRSGKLPIAYILP